jgi:dolichol-phosphate mannosyltransferase
MSGFFMIRRADFEALAPRLSTAGFKILLDILASRKRDMVIAEVPYSFRARLTGESKLGAHVAAEFAALLVSKVTGDRISPRFFLFALVGTSGIAVHLAALKAALSGLALSFEAAQTLAAFTAMTWNFFLNNALTYRDRRLTGTAMLKGLLSFYIVCSVGTIANVGVAQFVHGLDPSWWRAGLAGALMAAVFNYAVTSVVTWRK